MRLVVSLVCVVRSEVAARPRHRPLGSSVHCPSPLSSTFLIFVRIIGPTTWLVNRLESSEHCLLSQGPIVGYRFRRPWHVPCLGLLIGNISRMRIIWPCSAKHPDCFGEPLTSVAGRLGYVAPEELNQKGHGKPVDLWSIGYSHFLPH